MNKKFQLSAKAIDTLAIEEKNARISFMERLIGNAERHGEKSVAIAITRTMNDELSTT